MTHRPAGPQRPKLHRLEIEPERLRLRLIGALETTVMVSTTQPDPLYWPPPAIYPSRNISTGADVVSNDPSLLSRPM